MPQCNGKDFAKSPAEPDLAKVTIARSEESLQAICRDGSAMITAYPGAFGTGIGLMTCKRCLIQSSSGRWLARSLVATLRPQSGAAVDFTWLFVIFAATHFFLDAAALDYFSEAAHSFLNGFLFTYLQLYHNFSETVPPLNQCTTIGIRKRIPGQAIPNLNQIRPRWPNKEVGRSTTIYAIRARSRRVQADDSIVLARLLSSEVPRFFCDLSRCNPGKRRIRWQISRGRSLPFAPHFRSPVQGMTRAYR